MPDDDGLADDPQGRLPRDGPAVVIDSTALFEIVGKDEFGGLQRQLVSHGFEALRNGAPVPFGYAFDDRFTIAVVGQAAFNRDLVREVTDWVVADPGFLFTGGVLQVSRVIRRRVDFLVHGEGFDSYGYGRSVGEVLRLGSRGLEDWSAVVEHIGRAWAKGRQMEGPNQGG